jgi:O-acetyl-ADP-ribose deacetylase
LSYFWCQDRAKDCQLKTATVSTGTHTVIKSTMKQLIHDFGLVSLECEEQESRYAQIDRRSLSRSSIGSASETQSAMSLSASGGESASQFGSCIVTFSGFKEALHGFELHIKQLDDKLRIASAPVHIAASATAQLVLLSPALALFRESVQRELEATQQVLTWSSSWKPDANAAASVPRSSAQAPLSAAASHTTPLTGLVEIGVVRATETSITACAVLVTRRFQERMEMLSSSRYAMQFNSEIEREYAIKSSKLASDLMNIGVMFEATPHAPAVHVLGQATFGCGQVQVVHAEWAACSVEALVNAANAQLQHIGGFAASLRLAADARGSEFSRASAKLAPVRTGEAKIQPAHELQQAQALLRHIIHASVPPYDHKVPSKVLRGQLASCVTQALQLGNSCGAASIGIPSLGCGVYGWPVEEAAVVIIQAIEDFFRSLSSNTPLALKRVVLLDNVSSVASQFKSILDRIVSSGSAAVQAEMLRAASASGSSGKAEASRSLKSEKHYQWYFEHKGLIPYDSDANKKLEAKYQHLRRYREAGYAVEDYDWSVLLHPMEAGTVAQSKFAVPGQALYKVDVLKMTQTNQMSEFVRQVRRERVHVSPAADVPSIATAIKPAEQGFANKASRSALSSASAVPASSKPAKCSAVIVAVDKAAGNQAAVLVSDAFRAATISRAFQLQTVGCSAGILDFARDVLPSLQEEITRVKAWVVGSDAAAWSITVECLSPDVMSSVAEIVSCLQTRVLQLQAEQLVSAKTHAEAAAAAAAAEVAASTFQIPSYWAPMKAGKAFQLVEVVQGSAEYAKIQGIFNDGFPATIVKIERVQNPVLLERFEQTRRLIARECGGSANERTNMRHGSRQTDPKTICERGFDFRHSQEGMFGRGAYFSSSTRYSDAYRFQGLAGDHQMFIASVVCGKIERRHADRSIRHPTPGFHSIEGLVNQSDLAIIVYDLAQAYPSYLVTYTHGHSLYYRQY